MRDIARYMTEIDGLGARHKSLLTSYRVEMQDCNYIAKSEHRLDALHYTSAGRLPDKNLVFYVHALDMADAFP